MKRLLLLTGIIMALGASGAQAQTTITCEPCAYPYQRWVDEAKVPTPDVTEQVVESASAPCEEVLACTDGPTIYLLSHLAVRGTFYHELGHVFAFFNFPELYTSERFADSYAFCAQGQKVKPRWLLSVGEGLTTGRQLERFCRMIRRTGT
jgi:hypothetical protein